MPGMHLTYYDVLGVPMYATRAEIQKAYTDQLVQSHPGVQTKDNDSTPYDPHVQADRQRVAWLTRAHHVLGNDTLRRIYDAYLWTRGVQLTPDLHPQVARRTCDKSDKSDKSDKTQADGEGNDTSAGTTTGNDDDSAAAAASRDGDAVVTRVHVDPATNARYEYTRSADGARRQFAYYYDSTKDPSFASRQTRSSKDDDNKKDNDKKDNDDNTPTTTADKRADDGAAQTRDSDDRSSGDGDTKKATTTESPSSSEALLPRRARVIEQQIHDAGHPLYSLCSVPLVGGVSLGDATIYVLVP